MTIEQDKIVNDYVLIYLPEHPHGHDGFVYEHRYIVEQAIGRYLEPSESVHHIDEIKYHNTLDNLYLTTNEEHVAIHTRGIKRSAENRYRMRKGQRTVQKSKRADGQPTVKYINKTGATGVDTIR